VNDFWLFFLPSIGLVYVALVAGLVTGCLGTFALVWIVDDTRMSRIEKLWRWAWGY